MTLEDLKTSQFEKPRGEGNRNHFTAFHIGFWVHALESCQEMEDIASSLHPLDYLDAVAWLCAPKTADSPW